MPQFKSSDHAIAALNDLIDQLGVHGIINTLAQEIWDRATNGPSEARPDDPYIVLSTKLTRLEDIAKVCDERGKPAGNEKFDQYPNVFSRSPAAVNFAKGCSDDRVAVQVGRKFAVVKRAFAKRMKLKVVK